MARTKNPTTSPQATPSKKKVVPSPKVAKKPKSPTAGPVDTPRSSKKKAKWSAAKRKARKEALEREEEGGEMEVIDMTALEDEDEVDIKAANEEEQINGGDPGPSTARSRAASIAPQISQVESAVYTPTAFRPLKRSMASAFAHISPSPELAPEKPTPLTESAPHLTADIVIEEKSSHASSRPTGEAGPSKHFDPPGMFTSSMIPLSLDQIASTSSGTGESSKSDKQEVPLLLPSHVQIDAILSQGAAEEEEALQRVEAEQSMEGLHFFDTDVAKGTTRYFDPDADEDPQGDEATFLATADQSKICTNCKKPGHKPRDCPHIICLTCGEIDSHERRDCPFGVTCFSCGLRGHRQQECPDPVSKAARRQGCTKCGNRDHKDNSCPSLWRIYLYHSAAARQSILAEKRKETGWAKEAVGGDSYAEWCYNCAKQGHLGDDCASRRGSLARLTTPSAFSAQISSSGPFAKLGRRPANAATPTHHRWGGDHDDYDDTTDLPGLTKPFGGLGAGRKTREKARQRAAELDLDAGLSDDDDTAFVSHSRPGPSGGRGMSIRGIARGRGGGRGTPMAQLSRRAWDSEHRERDRAVPMRNAPFSHSHLMSPSIPSAPATVPAKPKGIIFGNISSLPVRPEPPTPPNFGPNGPLKTGDGWKNRASKALIERALGYTSAPTSRSRSPVSAASPLSQQADESPRKRRRRQEDPSERDWEEDWRGKGNGGGNVQDWGKMEDERERRERRAAERDGRELKGDGGSRYGIANGRGGGGTPRGDRGGQGGGNVRGGRGGQGGGRGGQGPATPVGQRYRGNY